MPPAPCAPEQAELIDDSTIPATSTAYKAVLPTKPSAPHRVIAPIFPRYSFLWEINLLSAAGLYLIYRSLSPDYHNYFYGVILLLAIEAARYYSIKGTMAGVPYTMPLVSIIAMLVHPVRFWAEQGALAMESPDGMSSNILGGKFMAFITDPKLVKQIFTGEGTFQLYAHPNAKWLFGANNLIYMDTEPHKRFRALLTPALFSNEALTLYAKAQEKVCRQYLKKYASESNGKPIDIRIAFRSIGAAASQESFLGPYLNDAARKHLEEDILAFTNGFLSFPFPYLGGLAAAIRAKKRIQKTILSYMPAARAYIHSGKEPRCLLEHWTLAIMERAKEEGVKPEDVDGCSDLDVAITVMDFLFAAQDATNSALTFAADVLNKRPDVVEKIRTEVAHDTNNGEHEIGPLVNTTDRLVYTSKASVQMLHHKPPVPMVPHLVLKDTVLAGRHIPKGAVMIPSLAYSARVSGISANYNPEAEQSDNMFVKNMVFGGGQHKCPGRRYAESLLTTFLAVFLPDYDFDRVGDRPALNEIMYYPTLFPRQNMFTITPRN